MDAATRTRGKKSFLTCRMSGRELTCTAETKRALAALPFRIDIRALGGHLSGPTLTLLHGNQTLNTVYVTEDRSDDFLTKMGQGVGARDGDVVAFGHTHKPWHRVVNGVHFVNTGSVGRPKDGDWRAGYVMLSIGANGIDVEFVRVEYDVDRAATAILDSTLPARVRGVSAIGRNIARSRHRAWHRSHAGVSPSCSARSRWWRSDRVPLWSRRARMPLGIPGVAWRSALPSR